MSNNEKLFKFSDRDNAVRYIIDKIFSESDEFKDVATGILQNASTESIINQANSIIVAESIEVYTNPILDVLTKYGETCSIISFSVYDIINIIAQSTFIMGLDHLTNFLTRISDKELQGSNLFAHGCGPTMYLHIKECKNEAFFEFVSSNCKGFYNSNRKIAFIQLLPRADYTVLDTIIRKIFELY